MHEPIFYANLPDDLHCSQACIRMVCEALGKPLSWDEADVLTGFRPGFYTWPPKSIVGLNRLFPGTRYLTDFDYECFLKKGRAYLLEYYHGDTAWVDDQEKHASPQFQQEHLEAKEMLEAELLVKENLTAVTLKDAVEKNLLIAFVHFGLLHGVDNNAGHAIFIYHVEGDEILFHDPGLPPRPAQRVSIDHFMKAYRNGATLIPRHKDLLHRSYSSSVIE